jgi:hypothetical protein
VIVLQLEGQGPAQQAIDGEMEDAAHAPPEGHSHAEASPSQ